MIRLNAVELDDLLATVGFTGFTEGRANEAPTDYRRAAWAGAMRESSGTVDIVGGPNVNGSYDYGLFQINDIHREDPDIDWSRILRGKYNARIAHRWSNGGRNWSTWGLGLEGWAGWLYETNRPAWEQARDRWQRWYDVYPAELEAARELMLRPGIRVLVLVPGSDHPDVLVYQRALREHLVAHGALGDLNPKGPEALTTFYGKAARQMTKAAYEHAVRDTGDPSWGRGDLTVPGPSLIYRIGLRPLWE